ncbi:MAG TPA: isoprenylcysteine carboxylmethyltransferase family protein [Candidatus Udaeobacter sp.]|nr:isoprenylcysteine carboxylmethyltransferase family protein [Candidatus Udaeobacter sp.]
MSIPKIVAGVVFNVAFYALLLFAPARTLHWWRAWVFLAVTIGVMAVAIFSSLPDSADLFSQRAKGVIQKGQPLWDRVLVILLVVSYVAQIVFIPLDVFWFHLTPRPSWLVSFLGLALYVAGWWIITLAMKANPFAVPVVRLQEDRHQRVIDTGVYAVVRHPMYAGFVPMVVGPALWLDSYVAAMLAIVPIAVLAVRSVFEERFLKRELGGYEAYTEKVRYRLIPFVW